MSRKLLNSSGTRAVMALVCTAVLLAVLPLHGAGIPDLGHLTLAAAVETALSRNLFVEAETYTVDSSRALILSEEGKFNPVLKFNVGHSAGGFETLTQLGPTNEMGFNADVSLELKSKLGSIYEFRIGSDWVSGESDFILRDPYYDSEVAFTLTQPLLKGFGDDIPTTGIRVAKNNLEMSRLRYDETLVATVAGAVENYWELFFARADLDVARLSLELARNLLSEVRDRIRVGKLASIEVFQAEAEVAVRQEMLIRARKAVSDAEDQLREVMNIQEWNRNIVTADEPPEPVVPMDLDVAIQRALENRQDFKRSLIDNENKKEMKRYYENQRKSQLDLFATIRSNSVDDHMKNVPWSAFPMDVATMTAGLIYSRPLGGGEVEGLYTRAVSEEERTLVLIKVMEQRIRFEVREAWRNVNVATESIEATTATRIAVDRRMRAEEEKFRVGKATLNDVLESQAEFTSALSGEKRSRAYYAIALVQLAKQTGTLLDYID